ncbi:MAG: hypothetical protein ABJE66_08885 [Deltaproteobacteria bacterium]
MKRARRACALLALCITSSTARADDLPPELVARPPTLPAGMIAISIGAGYDVAHVLGITVVSAAGLTLAIQRGMTSRLELTVGSGQLLVIDDTFDRITE